MENQDINTIRKEELEERQTVPAEEHLFGYVSFLVWLHQASHEHKEEHIEFSR